MKKIIKEIEQRIKQFGYEEYQINLFEEYDYYYQNRDFIDENTILKVIHSSGFLYAVQADITLSAAKVFSNKKMKLNRTQKIYYHGQTYSSIVAPNTGIRSRNVLGVEWFGVNDIYSDVEVLQLAYKSLSCIQRKCILEISDSEVLRQLLTELSLTESEQKMAKEFIWSKNVDELTNFLKRCGVQEDDQQPLLSICGIKGTLKTACEKLERLKDNEAIHRCFTYFSHLQRYTDACSISEYIYVDFTLKNKREYYQGIMFSGFIEGIYQPVLRGGRYGLVQNTLKNSFSSIGFSFELDDIIETKATPKKRINCLVLYKEPSPKIVSFVESLRKKGQSATALAYEQMLTEEQNVLATRYDTIYHYENGEFRKEELQCI